MNKLISSALITAISLLLLSTVSTATDGIMVAEDSAWVRATPPGSKTTAIYLTLMNHSNTDIDLTKVSVDVSDRVELHTHTNHDGMMKMQEISSITVPADGQASLEPHGDHIMVFNLQEPLKAGKEVSLELTFNDGNTMTLAIPVHKESPVSGDKPTNHDGMQHHGEHKDMKKNESDDSHQHDPAS